MPVRVEPGSIQAHDGGGLPTVQWLDDNQVLVMWFSLWTRRATSKLDASAWGTAGWMEKIILPEVLEPPGWCPIWPGV